MSKKDRIRTPRRKHLDIFKRLYLRTTGYSYANLARLFLRLFVGVMLMQFGIRQFVHFDTMSQTFPAVFGMSSTSSLVLMSLIEIVCSLFIMAGFLTRLMAIPPFLALGVAEYYLLHNVAGVAPYQLGWDRLGYLPIMFMGIYFFILLAGPGKISVDYFLSLHIIHKSNRDEEEELEQV